MLSSRWDPFEFPIVPFSHFFSPWFLLSHHHAALFSSPNLLHLLLLPSPPLRPSLTSWGTLISPSLPSPPLCLAPPVCKAGVSQDKEDSNYLTKETTGSWG